MACPSTRWHSGSLSSVFICDVRLSQKQTGEKVHAPFPIMLHMLSSWNPNSFYVFPSRSWGIVLGFWEALLRQGEGVACATLSGLAALGFTQGLLKTTLSQNITGLLCSSNPSFRFSWFFCSLVLYLFLSLALRPSHLISPLLFLSLYFFCIFLSLFLPYFATLLHLICWPRKWITVLTCMI